MTKAAHKANRRANYLNEIVVSADNLNRAFKQHGLDLEVVFEQGSPLNGVSHKVKIGETNFYTGNKLREVAIVLQAARRTLDFTLQEQKSAQERRVEIGIQRDREEERIHRNKREFEEFGKV